MELVAKTSPRVSLIIPALNEEEAIRYTLAGLPWNFLSECIVVDNGSTDATAEVATLLGAKVISEPVRGYGQACWSGVLAASPENEVIAFMDGDGSDIADDLCLLLAPVFSGDADFVIGSRLRGIREPGSMLASQIFAGWFTGILLWLRYRFRYTDMGPMRVIRRDRLLELGMTERTYGWNIEMQIRALQKGLRIREVPTGCRRRAAGVSKVSGSFWVSVRAGLRILKVVYRTGIFFCDLSTQKR